MTKADDRAPRADGVATRQRILEVAGEAFAAAGFAATPSKKIAEKAGVNLASINHHFGNRDGLYQAVLAEAHRRLVDTKQLERALAAGRTADDKLGALIRLLIHGSTTGERWPLIVLAREVMMPSPHILALQQEEVRPKLQLILPILGDLAKLPADDPRLLLIVPGIVAPCALFALAGKLDTPLTNKISGVEAEDTVAFLSTFIQGGLMRLRDGELEK